jgi:hypothetical protein
MFQQYVGPNMKGKKALLSSDITEAEVALHSLRSHCRREILQVSLLTIIYWVMGVFSGGKMAEE